MKQFCRKICLSFYLKGFEMVTKWFYCERELETEQNCNISAITTFLSRSPGQLNRGPGGPASLGHVPHSSIFSSTGLVSNYLTSCLHPGYIFVRHPPSCGRHKSHSFNPSTVKVISRYSLTGWTCYLHRCISYFDSLAGLSMLQNID